MARTTVSEDLAPRLSRTRLALLEAGRRMVFSGRMDGAAIDDIVREADVAKGSFFNHFQSQQDLAAQVLASVRTELEACVAEANEGIDDGAVRLARGLLAALRYGMEHRIGASTMLFAGSGESEPDQHPLLLQDLRRAAEQGRIRLEDLEAGVVLVLGLTDLGMSRLLDLRLDFSRARETMEELVLLLLRGLGVEGRRAERIVAQTVEHVIDAPRRATRSA